MDTSDEPSSFGWLLYKQRFWVLFITMFTSFSAGIVSDHLETLKLRGSSEEDSVRVL